MCMELIKHTDNLGYNSRVPTMGLDSSFGKSVGLCILYRMLTLQVNNTLQSLFLYSPPQNVNIVHTHITMLICMDTILTWLMGVFTHGENCQCAWFPIGNQRPLSYCGHFYPGSLHTQV